MKKIFAGSMLLLCLLQACKDKDDLVFDKRPDERAKELSEHYQKDLMDAPNGWMAYLYPDGGKGYTFYFNFSDSIHVRMYTDFDNSLLKEANEGTYHLQELQTVSLVFDTYSYVHLLADPDPGVAGGTEGLGYGSDFEFGFTRQNADSIFLTGGFNDSQLILVKAKEDEEKKFTGGEYLAKIAAFKSFIPENKFLYFEDQNGKPIGLFVDDKGKSVSFLWNDEDNSYQSQVVPFAYTFDGLLMKSQPIKDSVVVSLIKWVAGANAVTGLQVVLSNGDVREVKISDSSMVNMGDVNALIGPDKDFASLMVAPEIVSTEYWSAKFLDAFNRSKDNIADGGENFDNLTLFFDQDDKMILRTRASSGNTYYLGDFEFTLAKDENSFYSFKYVGPYKESNERYGYGNAQYYEPSVRDLLQYFDGKQFHFSWSPDGPNEKKVKLIDNADESSFVIGAFGK